MTSFKLRASFLFGLLAVTLTGCKSGEDRCPAEAGQCPHAAQANAAVAEPAKTESGGGCPYLASQGETSAQHGGVNPHTDGGAAAAPTPAPKPPAEQPRIKRIDEWPSEKAVIGDLPEAVRVRLGEVALGGVLHEIYRQDRLGDKKTYTYIFHIQRDADQKFYVAEVAYDGTLISNNPR